MPNRKQIVFCLYTALNGLAALGWLAPSGWGVSLLAGLALSGAIIWYWHRTAGAAPSSRAMRLYFTVSKIGWTLSCLPIGGGMALWIAVEEPWPLSLRHGPDTPYAREVFTQHMQFVPPASVTALYGRRAWAGFGEHITSITFRFTDEEVIRTMVTTLSLELVPPGEVQMLRALAGPGWWPAQAMLSRLPEAYRHKWGADPQVFRHLWIDRVQRRVYFQDVDIG
ncbi:MAG: hypothetical protein AB7N91_23950 [Candidatus Tectimicrobiota bacterium]